MSKRGLRLPCSVKGKGAEKRTEAGSGYEVAVEGWKYWS